jgi:hypothetical protein
MKTLQISIAVCVLISLVGTAFTATPIIKLNVPVQLTTLNEGVEAVRVVSYTYGPNSAYVVADGVVEIPCPADGNINQTVVVQLKQREGKDIREADDTGVALELKVNGVWKRPDDEPQTAIETRCKEGTQHLLVQHATIPW